MTEAIALIEAAEAWIDETTGRDWLDDGSASVESPTAYNGVVRVARPIAAVSQVRTRASFPGAEWTILVNEQDYWVVDATYGKIQLSSYWGSRWHYYRVFEVTYTSPPSTVVDPRIELAATDLAAFWMQPILTGLTGNIQSYRVGDDLQVTYQSGGMVLGIPDDIARRVAFLGRRTVLA